MSVRAVLEDLRGMLADKLPELKTADVWDGAWDEIASARYKSFAAPAALVSLTGLALDRQGQQAFHPRQLIRGEELPPPAVQVRIDAAVTFVSGRPKAPDRAEEVLALAEAAVPVLVWAALEDIRGTNLYSPALRKAGMSAFALIGARTVELAPEHPAPQLPRSVRARGRVSAEDGVIWEGDDG